MAQLVKLYNYISRYERNIYHYPGQFIRLKKKKWERTNHEWNNPPRMIQQDEPEKPKLSWKRKFKKEKSPENDEVKEMPVLLTDLEKKQRFLDLIFPSQLQWASSTVSKLSFIDDDFRRDETLKYFLQRYPDTYLLFYHPVFNLKNGTMETDVLFVGPYGIDIIRVIESSQSQYFTAENERVWLMGSERMKKRVISPMLSLNRSERVIKGILEFHGIDFPVRKVVLSRMNEIYYSHSVYNTTYVDRRTHQEWVERKRADAYLLKHKQLQVCGLLLSHCDCVAFQRPEWDSGEETDEGFANFN